MQNNSAQEANKTQDFIGDIWGGLAAMLVALPSSIAFGVLTYTVMGTEYAGMGAMAGILGAAAMGLVAPLIGRTPGLISAPCAPSAAVLSAFIYALFSGADGHTFTPEAILPLVAITALLAALLQIAYGLIGGGKLIKFIPFPVVSGYLSAVGVLIALGQIPKILGLPKDTPLWDGILSPSLWRWESLVIGLVTILFMALAPLVTDKLPSAILGLFGGIATYFIIAIFSPHLLILEGNTLVIGLIHSSGSFIDMTLMRFKSFALLDISAFKMVIVPALTLSVLLSIDTLKTCVGLDNITRNRHKSDRELIGQGLANLTAFVAGGMPGAGTMGPTLVNVTSGAKTYRAGLMEGVFVIFVLLLMSQLIAWVPIGALAGILLVIAWRMFDQNMFRLLTYKAGRLDFTVIAAVIIVALMDDLIAASGMGIALSILLFIRDQINTSVVRSRHDLSQRHSKTRRLPSEREILKSHGQQGVLCELQGNLFFGTTDQLFTYLENDLKQSRYVLFDLRRVRSIDYTAVHLFEQMQAQLHDKGGQLLFCGMPTTQDFMGYLHKQGLIQPEGQVMVSDTLDGALEWIENQILEQALHKNEAVIQPLEASEFHLFKDFDEQTMRALVGCLKERSLESGEKLFASGDIGGELFLVRKGSIKVILPLGGGSYHHLATIGRGDYFGELSFLDGQSRSADVLAKESTLLYVMSRAEFDEKSKTDAYLSTKVFSRLATVIAERLREADSELRILEER